ncbi:MAG: cytochrome bd-I oxidase subunit CydX [Methylophilaceae bacterium]|nr:cytochrome bd-I oxidase subunit CydX [Methylovorus sp. MM2]OAM51451.1 cyd operon protein YbgT [Methylovorus sp. MM2]
MWYFTWILGVGLALAFGIINVMWLEAEYPFDEQAENSET